MVQQSYCLARWTVHYSVGAGGTTGVGTALVVHNANTERVADLRAVWPGDPDQLAGSHPKCAQAAVPVISKAQDPAEQAHRCLSGAQLKVRTGLQHPSAAYCPRVSHSPLTSINDASSMIGTVLGQTLDDRIPIGQAFAGCGTIQGTCCVEQAPNLLACVALKSKAQRMY